MDSIVIVESGSAWILTCGSLTLGEPVHKSERQISALPFEIDGIGNQFFAGSPLAKYQGIWHVPRIAAGWLTCKGLRRIILGVMSGKKLSGVAEEGILRDIDPRAPAATRKEN